MHLVNARYWKRLFIHEHFLQMSKGLLELESMVGRRLKLPRVSFRRSGSEMPLPDYSRQFSQKIILRISTTHAEIPMGAAQY